MGAHVLNNTQYRDINFAEHVKCFTRIKQGDVLRGREEAIFGHGGGEQMAADFEIPLLGKLPLAMEIRSALDEGKPTVAESPESPLTQSYGKLALRTAGALAILPRSMTFKMPEIVVSN